MHHSSSHMKSYFFIFIFHSSTAIFSGMSFHMNLYNNLHHIYPSTKLIPHLDIPFPKMLSSAALNTSLILHLCAYRVGYSLCLYIHVPHVLLPPPLYHPRTTNPAVHMCKSIFSFCIKTKTKKK